MTKARGEERDRERALAETERALARSLGEISRLAGVIEGAGAAADPGRARRLLRRMADALDQAEWCRQRVTRLVAPPSYRGAYRRARAAST